MGGGRGTRQGNWGQQLLVLVENGSRERGEAKYTIAHYPNARLFLKRRHALDDVMDYCDSILMGSGASVSTLGEPGHEAS